jgi:hypothetical protein
MLRAAFSAALPRALTLCVASLARAQRLPSPTPRRAAAWLLIDERTDGTRIDDGLDGATSSAWPCHTPSTLEWSPIIGDASGDLGYTVRTATIRGERGVHYSKYLTVWKRQRDGAWRFVVDGGNAAPARVATFTAQR